MAMPILHGADLPLLAVVSRVYGEAFGDAVIARPYD